MCLKNYVKAVSQNLWKSKKGDNTRARSCTQFRPYSRESNILALNKIRDH